MVSNSAPARCPEDPTPAEPKVSCPVRALASAVLADYNSTRRYRAKYHDDKIPTYRLPIDLVRKIGLQTLAFRPEIARETLKALARWQGRELDPRHDEEPGKILHEYRRGEVSVVGELPFHLYYGSIDSTLLFLLLIAEYFAWTGDRGLLRQLRDLRPHQGQFVILKE